MVSVYSSAEMNWKTGELKDKMLDEKFRKANEFVLNYSRSDDGLRLGYLENSNSLNMLEKALGVTTTQMAGIGKWNAQQVKFMWAKADWDFEYDDDLVWAYWSARVFLQACSEAGLSIVFNNS